MTRVAQVLSGEYSRHSVPVCQQCGSEYHSPARFCGQCGASLPDLRVSVDAVDPWLGKVVDRRYRVLSRIGAGGMGLVYRVEHIQLGKIAAMKVLHADTARDSEAVRRFRTEAQAVSRLSHSNIVQTFDFGEFEGALYLVMEYVRGDDLASLVKREGPLSFERAAPLFVQICSALTEAHDSGVIHRDLKPENIVIVPRRDGTAHAKVLDFGLAKLRERADGADVTSRGIVIGTPHYMSPEQVRAEPLDVRTDIYSLGATLYRVLTGTPPFEAPTPVGVLTMHITDPLEPLRVRAPELNLPAEADAIVARAMAKAREDRYSSAAEVQRDLEAAMLGGRGAEKAERSRTRELQHASASSIPDRRDRATGHARAVTVQAPEKSSWAPVADPSDSRDIAGDERLRRQEFDAFERSLRRKKFVASVIVPMLFLSAVAIAGFLVFGRGREKPSAIEREPNNSPSDSTLVPLDTPVLGTIGARLAEGQPDMDYFRVPSSKDRRVVSARVEGIPEVDLVLELFDSEGTSLSKADSHGVGGGEWLQPVTVAPGEAYLLVRQVWIQGAPLVENGANPYHVVVHWAAPTPGWEEEPNDWPERATPATAGKSYQGYLASSEDKDWFVVHPERSGQVVARLIPPSGGVDIVLTAGVGSTARRASGGKNDGVLELRIPATAGEDIAIGLARQGRDDNDPKMNPPAGMDNPYELKLELRGAPQ